MNRDFVNFYHSRGIEKKILSGYNPQANEQVEVQKQNPISYLRLVMDYPQELSKYLPN